MSSEAEGRDTGSLADGDSFCFKVALFACSRVVLGIPNFSRTEIWLKSPANRIEDLWPESKSPSVVRHGSASNRQCAAAKVGRWFCRAFGFG